MTLEMQIIDDTPAPLAMTVESAEFDVGGTTDFNSLSNRPQYNGVPMTSTTNIPLVPDNLTEIIPSQASTENQLADKDFVNSSIATATAEFVGTFSTIEELEAIQTANNNDYGFVVEVDEAGNTVYNRYKYNGGEGWLFEYALNNSSFTAAQWAAIQSGITAQLVQKLNNLANIKSVGEGLALNTDTGELTSEGNEVVLYEGIGTNTDGAMTQAATTDMIFEESDPAQIRIGDQAAAGGQFGIAIGRKASNSAGMPGGIAIGFGARTQGQFNIAIGSYNASTKGDFAISIGGRACGKGNVAVGVDAFLNNESLKGVIALGKSSGQNITASGMMDIGSSDTSYGYNSTNYRLLTGVHDGQGANDAVTVGQVNATIDAINEALGVAIPHIGA